MERSSAMMPTNTRSQDTKNAEVPNEESNSKIIKLSEEAANNLDPLVHFSRFLGISEMILNHLSAKDLMKFSEVSPLWYNVIASSKVLMENIKVVFNGIRELQTKDYDLLKNSSRKYQIIEVRRVKKLSHPPISKIDFITDLELDFFLSKVHDWKSVSLTETHFRRKLDLYKFLSSIESSVERFSVSSRFNGDAFPFDHGSSSNSKSFKVLMFPKLKHLKIQFIKFHLMGLSYVEFLVNSVAIERFDFQDSHSFIAMGSAKCTKTLTKMLENFVKLTSLSIETNQNNMFEDQTWKRFHFKLKSLAIDVVRYEELHSTFLRNFINSQKDHLEELEIECLFNDIEMFNNIMRLPKLKILNFGAILFLSKEVVPNLISTSITHLECKHIMEPDLGSYPEALIFLMKSMPNVKSVHLHSSSNISRALLEMKRKYKELKAVRFSYEKEDL